MTERVNSEQSDLFGARSARDEAMSRVEKNAGQDFMGAALGFIAQMESQRVIIAETIRLEYLNAGHCRPHHHNAWGTVIMQAVKRGLLTPLNQYEHMRTVRSHGRKTPKYRVR